MKKAILLGSPIFNFSLFTGAKEGEGGEGGQGGQGSGGGDPQPSRHELFVNSLELSDEFKAKFGDEKIKVEDLAKDFFTNYETAVKGRLGEAFKQEIESKHKGAMMGQAYSLVEKTIAEKYGFKVEDFGDEKGRYERMIAKGIENQKAAIADIKAKAGEGGANAIQLSQQLETANAALKSWEDKFNGLQKTHETTIAGLEESYEIKGIVSQMSQAIENANPAISPTVRLKIINADLAQVDLKKDPSGKIWVYKNGTQVKKSETENYDLNSYFAKIVVDNNLQSQQAAGGGGQGGGAGNAGGGNGTPGGGVKPHFIHPNAVK